jgi:hypothetical protein
LYKHRKNKHHIFFKSRVSLPELNALLSAGCPWRLLPHGLLDRSATLHLNALNQYLEIIAQHSPGENDRLKVTVAQWFPRFGGRLRSLLGAKGALVGKAIDQPSTVLSTIISIKTAEVPMVLFAQGGFWCFLECLGCCWNSLGAGVAVIMGYRSGLMRASLKHAKMAVFQQRGTTMSPQLEQILQQIDLLPLVEQTKILRQLEQKIDPAHGNEAPASNAQQQWQQTIDTIRHQTPIDLERQKARIFDMFAQFNQDEDEAEQQEALKIISSIAKTSI